MPRRRRRCERVLAVPGLTLLAEPCLSSLTPASTSVWTLLRCQKLKFWLLFVYLTEDAARGARTRPPVPVVSTCNMQTAEFSGLNGGRTDPFRLLQRTRLIHDRL